MELQKIISWLKSWPGWQEGAKLYVDYTDTVPGNCGLFPIGTEEVSRKADVLGNLTAVYRFRFVLYRVVEHTDDGAQSAQWAQDLQEWVRQQNSLGLAPVLGDDPARENILAEKGRLYKTRQPGNRMYAVDFTAEFIKFYEVKENG
jgi:hypothetical protein